ncbi:ribosomal protein S18-alanine N-acetyltransferase [Apilactobacillus timberlakei]|uniref:Ribosomal-protein-alanine N-acetyltransferase n=1 Tax=Apilactobacillus timberlakei TaxID=2008380 RepID=A0ABY2YT44_9LACO|nr:ribosomal protein S18-alanine N-acetyltransferase [Apilactobacillus timberlakei]TPR12550.1 ribosomal-protein-alanine N-acetyltransferase [Apilactobacillus timberlakei]TPR13381.1 ribosomal-protein-alanine N-acetyltransferase [Apilactobacillus timberlakei]TPR15454.1 ribosomal-protein-alanine N-acetyltransferase [Apilactobacillus timberlakei]TPR17713.1 ribosomal-protein-alanine N-acetyltransferase [Apilactobacillus timberlakei]TPR17930.1 ribosomal-protein-alanine N-acetyltransferase [Apilactob
MLKNLINWYRKTFLNTNKSFKRECLKVKNHNVEINDHKYYVAKAMITDIPDIMKVEKSVYNGATPWTADVFETELRRRDDRFYLLVRYRDQLVAFIGSSLNDKEKDCHISNVAVLSEFQDRGLGYFLIAKVIQKARQLEYETVSLEVRLSNVRAQRLYSDLGFKKNGLKKNYYDDDNEDALDMVLDLNLYETIPNNFGI